VFRHHNLRNELFKDLREQLKDTSKCVQQHQQQLGQWLAALACRQQKQQQQQQQQQETSPASSPLSPVSPQTATAANSDVCQLFGRYPEHVWVCVNRELLILAS
jgi:hypothetical protein